MVNLIQSSPEEAGVDPTRVARMDARLAELTDGFRQRSLVALAARRGKIFFHKAYGPQTDKDNSPPCQLDTVFTVNSCSKPVTAALAMFLVEDGRLGLNRPVKDYLPEVCGKGSNDIQVQHLFTHSTGHSELEFHERFPVRLRDLKDIPTEDEPTQYKFMARQLACTWDLDCHFSPGTKMDYCNHHYDWIAEIVRRVSGQTIDEFAKERLFDPLGMQDTSYVLNDDDEQFSRLAFRGDGQPFGTVEGNPIGGIQGMWVRSTPFGGMGVSTTAPEFARFGQLFLDKGRVGNTQLLSPATVHEMSRNQVPGIPAGLLGAEHPEASWGLGFMVQHDERWPWANSTLCPKGTFYHVGSGGHLIWIDPVNEIVGVYLSVCLDMDVDLYITRSNLEIFQNMVTASVLD